MLKWLVLFLYAPLIHSQLNDVCVVRSRDGHSNELETISQTHCEMYDNLKNNQSTIQIIDLDGTIAGCWLYETDTTETIYFNINLNPSGMCASPHFCIQYTNCSALVSGSEVLYKSPTSSPTQSPTVLDMSGIDVANIPSVREDSAFETHTIIIIATLLLCSIATGLGFWMLKTQSKADVIYPV